MNVSKPASPAPTNGSEAVEVDGESIPRAAIEAYRNDTKWKSENTKRAQELAEREAEIARREALMADRERKVAEPPPEPPRTVVVEDEPVLDLSDMPNQLDDPAAYNAELAKRSAAFSRAHSTWTRRQVDQVRQDSVQQVRRAEARQQTTVQQATDFQSNKQTVSAYFAAHPEITTEQRQEIVALTDQMMRKPGKYGSVSPSGVFLFNERALEAADRSVRAEHFEARAKEEGFREGLTGRTSANNASRYGSRGGSAAPGKGASGQELAEYARTLPANSRAEQTFYDSLDDKQLNALLTADLEAHEQSLGA